VCQSSTSALSRLEQSSKQRDLSDGTRSDDPYSAYVQQARAPAAYDSYNRTAAAAAASNEHGANRESHRRLAESGWRWQRDDISPAHPAAVRAAPSAYLAPSTAAGAYTYASRPFAHASSSYAANSHAFLLSRTAAAAASAPFVPPYPLVHVNPYESHIGARFR
jgi:hypothetical protein